MALRRHVADWAIPVGIACMVLAFAAGSSSELWAKRTGLDARWILLVGLCAVALVDAGRRLRLTRSLPPRGLLRFGILAGSFLGVAVISTTWSVSPRLTFERAGSLAILFLLAAAIASSTSRDVAARIRVFQGLALGALAVGLVGVLVLVLDYGTAVQRGADTWRYRGFTENPNTIGILAGATLPIFAALAIRSTTRRRQAAWLAGGLLMVASLVASESRGGLLAACAGTLIVAAFGVEGLRQRAAAVTALVLVFGGGIALRQAVQPPAPTFTSSVAPVPPKVRAPTHPAVKKPRQSPAKQPRAKGKPGTGTGTGATGTPGTAKPGTGKTKPKHKRPVKHPAKPRGPSLIVKPSTKTSALPQEQDEIGHPALSKQASTTLASGRLAAWRGALDIIRQRPVLGYGFGTEQKVFVDRWYFFQGNSPENSYLGLLLQVGLIGLALVLALGCALAIGGVRAVRRLEGDARQLVLLELGVLAAAAAIMLIQSYLYSVGNVASATVWISLFALGSTALEPREAANRVRAVTTEMAA